MFLSKKFYYIPALAISYNHFEIILGSDGGEEKAKVVILINLFNAKSISKGFLELHRQSTKPQCKVPLRPLNKHIPLRLIKKLFYGIKSIQSVNDVDVAFSLIIFMLRIVE